MKYYCNTIPATLAEKLKEKGVPIPVEFIPNYLGDPEGEAVSKIVPPSYAFVFDWLMSEKRLDIIIKPYWNTDSWESYVTKFPEIDMPKAGREIYVRSTWHEAANAAIEKALTLI